MIQLRHRQPSLWHSGLAKDIEDLWEPWMKEIDQLLEDATLVESVYDAQGKRHPKSRTRGRTQTPAEVALRLLILKHVRNWSTTRWSEKYERTWSIAHSHALVFREGQLLTEVVQLVALGSSTRTRFPNLRNVR